MLSTAMRPPMRSTMRWEIERPKPGAAEPAGDAAVGLLELLEDAVVLVGRDADAGVAHQDVDLARPDTAARRRWRRRRGR